MFNISAFLSYVIVVTFTPGPNNIMSMANASKFGYKKTLNFILGVSSGFFIIVLLSSYFNLVLFNIIPKIKYFMGFLGAGYMIYLASKIIKQDNAHYEKNSVEPYDIDNNSNIKEKESKTNSFFTGITMQFINPKGILFAITVVSNFIIPYYNSNISLILFSCFLAFVAFLANSSWALFGSILNKFLFKYNREFNIVMGLLLIYSAISISGIRNLL